ncbi:anti-sigma factor [Phyllobacterium lublinensis]|uniref:anti-sigma factor n=1 Tax=Phyllobacterium lublinensis TaxID=2875708 RepID=UPI001CD0098B|nr:anti-sigma factor [Phyllobacterium sp. 2063]MBZ9656620.1 anti-sigma factor [Phyllobacterium sp. 2063]
MSSIPPEDTIPEGDDLIAAEYVLGVLPAEERRVVARRIETDQAFARLVARWQQHFDPLNEQFVAEPAPGDLKNRIDHRLFGTEQPPASIPLWNSVTFWRGLAFAAFALAVFGFGRDLIQPPTTTSSPQLVASMVADGSPVRTLAVFDDQTRLLKVSLVAGDVPQDRSLELWLIAGNEAPVSLGVITSPQVTAFDLPQPVADKLRDGTTLAITVEPVGGSPSGAPTGAVVAAGTVRGI